MATFSDSKLSSDNGEHEERIMNEILDKIRNEQPKVDTSLKNLLAVLSTWKPETKPKTIGSDPESNIVSSLPTNIILQYLRVLLQCIKQADLPSIEDYCRLYPQSLHQSAIERLDEILQYKAFYAYREHIVTSNQKISKIFGRSFLRNIKIWESIKSSFFQNIEVYPLPGNMKLANNEGRIIIEAYEASIFAEGK
jgi:hypothetical protein